MIKSNLFSILSGLLIVITVTSIQFYQKFWNQEMGVIKSDAKGYYGYLPATFINHDIKLENPEVYQISDGNHYLYFETTPEGKNYIKYSLGLSILYSPFFSVAHLFSEPLGYPSDGYSTPYQFAISMSAIVFLIIGLIFISKILRRYFSDGITALTLITIFLGTNILNYYTQNSSLSHIYSFAIISIFLFCSIKWTEKRSFKWAILSGFFGGLMVLIRPVDIIYLLFIFLFEVNSWNELIARIKELIQNFSQSIVFTGCFLLTWIPQLLYWKYVFGSYINYTYSGESFFFLNPKILLSLFDFRNGWLVYSPIMVFALIGCYLLQKSNKKLSTFMVVFIPLYVYVISSWWCWWYIGFGNRAFINLYPFLALPMGYFVAYLLSGKNMVKIIGLSTLFLFISLNLFQNYQFNHGVIHWSKMTKEAYWDSFLKSKPSQLFYSKLRDVDTELAHMGQYAIEEPFYDTVYQLKEGFDNEPNGTFHFNSNEIYGLSKLIPIKGADEVYISAWVKNPKNTILVINNKEKNNEVVKIQFYRASSEIHKSKKDWKLIHLWTRIPNNLNLENLEFYIWNEGGNEIWVDELNIITRTVKYESVLK